MCTKNELNSILQKLTQIYRSVYGENLVQVILYGSYARGDYKKDSDIDVAVVVPRSSLSKDILEDMAKLFKLRREISTDIEPVLLIDEDDASGFLESISKYGEVVYSR